MVQGDFSAFDWLDVQVAGLLYRCFCYRVTTGLLYRQLVICSFERIFSAICLYRIIYIRILVFKTAIHAFRLLYIRSLLLITTGWPYTSVHLYCWLSHNSRSDSVGPYTGLQTYTIYLYSCVFVHVYRRTCVRMYRYTDVHEHLYTWTFVHLNVCSG